MEIVTHNGIDQKLCGTPTKLETDFSRVELVSREEMAVDGSGLVHGGFIFGLADYAAMIAVNHPNVVLAAANVKFLKPVTVGDNMVAEARVVHAEGRKKTVTATVFRNDEKVFEGQFNCFVPDRHVLA